MKPTKKLIGLLLALAMIFSLATTALAAAETGSITINNAVAGQTYTIYRILDLESYNADHNAYAYKATSAWDAFINSTQIKDVYVAVDDQGYVTWVDGADAAAFAKAAKEYAGSHSIANQGSVTAASATVSFTGLDLGYYLVDTTLGTLCSLDTTNPDADIMEKNEAPVPDKQVQEDSDLSWGARNDADIGQTVNFTSTVTAHPGAENYVFHDAMSEGLTLQKASIRVNGVSVTDANGADLAGDDFTVTYPSGQDADGCTFEIAFSQSYLDAIADKTTITITYAATLNEKAVIAGSGNPNESKVSYGDSSNIKFTPASQTKTYTWDVDVFKYTLNDQEEMPLSGATFTLSKGADGASPIALISKGENQLGIAVYRVAMAGENNTITEITTNAAGKFTIEGLDSDTYYLTETAAPAGYNKLAGPITIVIDANGATSVDNTIVEEVQVLNQSGTELPTTGGMGTTVFYALGSVLALTAAVLLVTKKRMAMQD